MAGAIPDIQFAPYNPMDTALRAAMGVYSGMNEGRGQQITNKMNQAQLPYAKQNARNAAILKQIEADYGQQMTEAEYQQLLAQTDLSQLQAQYYPELTNSTITHNKALNDRIAMEIQKENLFMQNPGLYAGGDAAALAALTLMDKNQQPQQPYNPSAMGKVDVETSPSMGFENTPGPSFTRDQVLGAEQPGIPQQGFQPSPISQAKSNLEERLTMQPWEIVGKNKMAEQSAAAQYKNMTELNAKAAAATSNIGAIQTMNDAFESLPAPEGGLELLTGNEKSETGQVWGRLPPTSVAAKKIDSMLSNLLQNAQETWAGALSDSDIENIKSQFPSRVSGDAFRDLSDYVMAANARVLQKQQFMNSRLSQGQDVNQAEADWNAYSLQNSVYDQVKRLHELEAKERQQ